MAYLGEWSCPTLATSQTRHTPSPGLFLWLVSESNADPVQCASGLRSICVQSVSGDGVLHARPVFAPHPRSVYTELGQRALCVHATFTPRLLQYVRK